MVAPPRGWQGGRGYPQPWLCAFCSLNQVLCWARGAKGKRPAGRTRPASGIPRGGRENAARATEASGMPALGPSYQREGIRLPQGAPQPVEVTGENSLFLRGQGQPSAGPSVAEEWRPVQGWASALSLLPTPLTTSQLPLCEHSSLSSLRPSSSTGQGGAVVRSKSWVTMAAHHAWWLLVVFPKRS